MTTIAQGERATNTLRAGQQLQVTVSSGSALVERFIGSTLIDKDAVSASVRYGPYTEDLQYRVTCISGLISLELDSALRAFPDGSPVSTPGKLAIAAVRNQGVLSKAARRLAQARSRNIVVGLFGDSLAAGQGATAVGTLPTNEVAGNAFALPGVLRTLLNAPHGTRGGAWLSAASTDGRVTRSGGGAQLAGGYGPNYNLDTGGSAMNNSAFMQTASSHTLTFTLPACTEAKILTWEDYTANYGRTTNTMSVAVDGGGTISYAGLETAGANSAQRLGQSSNLTGMTDAAHSIVLAATAGNSMVHGMLYGYATGVTVFSMGVGSATSKNMLALNGSATQQDRIQRATFRMVPMDVAIIVIGHNDCSQQVAQGTTPAVTAANIQTAITQLRLNSGAPVILLVTDPATSLTQSPFDYPDYWPIITALADGTTDVAALTTAELLGTFAQGNAEGLYSDSIHLSNAGYADWGAAIAEVLTTARTYA